MKLTYHPFLLVPLVFLLLSQCSEKITLHPSPPKESKAVQQKSQLRALVYRLPAAAVGLTFPGYIYYLRSDSLQAVRTPFGLYVRFPDNIHFIYYPGGEELPSGGWTTKGVQRIGVEVDESDPNWGEVIRIFRQIPFDWQTRQKNAQIRGCYYTPYPGCQYSDDDEFYEEMGAPPGFPMGSSDAPSSGGTLLPPLEITGALTPPGGGVSAPITPVYLPPVNFSPDPPTSSTGEGSDSTHPPSDGSAPQTSTKPLPPPPASWVFSFDMDNLFPLKPPVFLDGALDHLVSAFNFNGEKEPTKPARGDLVPNPTYAPTVNSQGHVNKYGGTFGYTRKDGGKPKFHGGVDIKSPVGGGLKSMSGGKVIKAGHDEGPYNGMGKAGNYIKVKVNLNGEELIFVYMHLSQIDVNVGDGIEQGQGLGLTGKTGNANEK